MARIPCINRAGARGFYRDLMFSSWENENSDVFLLMISLGVSRCAGSIEKSNAETYEIDACGMGICNVFEACRFDGAGDLRFTMKSAQNKSQVLMRVEVGFVTDFERKRCDDLRTRFCIEMFGGCFIIRNGCAQSSICVGDA